MKNLFVFFSLVVISLSVNAQEQKVEIVTESFLINNNKQNIDDVFRFTCNAPWIVKKGISIDNHLPFKFYYFSSKNENWFNMQSFYNTIQAKVPNVTFSRAVDFNAIPNISMRSDDNAIVIVDGIRYDVSVLNTLNPADIESITVAPSAAATTYLRNN
jgi:hypothetical protein